MVTPQVAAPGRVTAVLVTLHGPESSQPVNVTLRLVSDRVEEVTQLISEVSQEIKGRTLSENSACSCSEAVICSCALLSSVIYIAFLTSFKTGTFTGFIRKHVLNEGFLEAS